MGSLILLLLLLFYFKAIFYLLLNLVMILSTLFTKVIPMSISLLAIFLDDVDAIEACQQEHKDTTTKIKREKLAIAPSFSDPLREKNKL